MRSHIDSAAGGNAVGITDATGGQETVVDDVDRAAGRRAFQVADRRG